MGKGQAQPPRARRHCTRPCEKRKDGALTVSKRVEERIQNGWATRPVLAHGQELRETHGPCRRLVFKLFGDTLRSGRRCHETIIERQDASAIHRLTPRRSCEDDRDGARTREQAHSARLR